MKVRELMTTDVITVGPEMPLKEAARRMIAARVSGLPVTDDSGALVGIVSEGDFVNAESGRRANTKPRLLRLFIGDDDTPTLSRTIGEIMTKDVVTITPEADHTAAARLMKTANVKRIPVLSDDWTLVGLISRSDILRAFARSDEDIVREATDYVMQKVMWIDPRKVEVICDDGNLSLSGHLETRGDAQLLVELVKRLDGVVSVHDALTWQVDNTKLEMVTPTPNRPNW